MLVGFSLCKNLNKYQYPIDLCIEQHKDLVDQHWFIVPKQSQDTDGTIKTIQETCNRLGIKPGFFTVDWPGESGFGEESIDKILQQRFIDEICPAFDTNDFFIKLDIDEFIHEKDFRQIKDTIKILEGTDITSISLNYLQFLGSVEFTCFDPTTRTTHIFRNSSNVHFAGSDAMNITTNGDDLYLEEVFIFHTGYVKSKELLSLKLREHFTLNQSVYKDVSNQFTDPNRITFEFPKHQKSAKLWPLGIAVLRGQENSIEYRKFDTEKLPLVLKTNVEKLRFYLPDMG